VFEKQLVPDGRETRYYKGLCIGLEEWDGSDFFIPRDTLHIIISERAMLLMKKAKITNAIFENLADIETPEFGLPKR
jgi:hypothetical protein